MLRLGGVGGLGEPRGRHGSDVALVHVRVRRCRPKLLPENMERGSSPVAALVELIGHHAAAVHDVHLDLGLVVVIGREGLVRVQPLLQRGRVRVSWTACKLLHVESLVCDGDGGNKGSESDFFFNGGYRLLVSFFLLI